MSSRPAHARLLRPTVRSRVTVLLGAAILLAGLPTTTVAAPRTVEAPSVASGRGAVTADARPLTPAEAGAIDDTQDAQPSILFEEAMAHANDRLSFVPGDRVTVGFAPAMHDGWPVDGHAPKKLPAGRATGRDMAVATQGSRWATLGAGEPATSPGRSSAPEASAPEAGSNAESGASAEPGTTAEPSPSSATDPAAEESDDPSAAPTDDAAARADAADAADAADGETRPPRPHQARHPPTSPMPPTPDPPPRSTRMARSPHRPPPVCGARSSGSCRIGSCRVRRARCATTSSRPSRTSRSAPTRRATSRSATAAATSRPAGPAGRAPT